MTQLVFDDIDPNVTSGTQLAVLLNDFKASLLTQNSGATAPTYKLVGTGWFDSAVAGKLTYKLYDGTSWVSQFVMDTAAHTIAYGGNNPTASFTVNRTDTAADMLEMYRNTQIASNGGLIYTQENDNATKKTFGAVKIIADSVADTAEVGSILFQAMIAGTIGDIASFSSTALNFKALEGIGDRVLSVDSSGNVTASAASSEANVFPDGDAKSADLGNWTANAPLTLAKSIVAADLINSTTVFKATSTAGSETMETADITVPNGFIDSPMIVSFEYKASAEWALELIDDNVATLATSTLEVYSQTLNEGSNHSFFAVIPSTSATVKLKFTSTAADTLIFNNVVFESWSAVDKPLYFNVDILNTQTNTDLFTITNRKNSVLKIEGQILRETDTVLADAIYSCYVSNNGTVNRVGKEDVFDHESDTVDTNLNMNGDIIRYSSSTIAGANYTGKFVGRITRVL